MTAEIEVRVEPLQRAILDGVEDPDDEDGQRMRVDLGVIPWFTDERPLHGLAGYIDWRSSGMLSALIRRGFCDGTQDETVLIPARLGLPIRRLVLVGFGDARTFGAADATVAAARAVGVANRLRPREVLFAMPAWLTDRGLVEEVFTGLADALRRGEGRKADDAVATRWWVVTDPRHVARLRRLLEGPPRAAAES